MSTINPQGRSLAQQQMLVQTTHAQQLKTVEDTLTRLAEERQKLATLEAELADLVRAIVDSPMSSTSERGPTCIIINPKAKCLGDGTCSLEEVEAALRAVGIVAEVCMTTPEQGAAHLARIAVERGDELLIVAGGDGTIEEAVTELVGKSTTLGILPMGTMNNVARVLGVPLDLHAACLLLAMGATRHIDIGRVVTPDHHRDGYFLESAGIGLSALAAPMGEAVEKGQWSEVFSKLGDFFSFNAAQVTISCDGAEPLQTETQVVTISNAPLFGNNMLIAPFAKVDDGWLDLAVYGGMNKVDLGRYFLNASNAGRVDEPRIHFRRVRSVHITADAPLEVNADLDILAGQHTWTFEVIPHAISVIVGNGIGLTFPVEAAPVASLSSLPTV